MMNWKQKALLAIVLAVVVWALFGCAQPFKSSDLSAGHPPSVDKLLARYMQLNKDCFNMELPGYDTAIRIRDLSTAKPPLMGHLDYNEGGPLHWIISIDHDTHPLEKQAEATLIHEMCHQFDKTHEISEGLDGHNENHEACMIRVAQRGGFHDIW